MMQLNQTNEYNAILDGKYADSELIIGLVGAVGTQLRRITEIIAERMPAYNYHAEIIRVSDNVIKQIFVPKSDSDSEYERINKYMNLGNLAREQSGDNSILALGVASHILSKREPGDNDEIKPRKRVSYIINSLKHPEEVERLREIYSRGFFLISVYSSEESRKDVLINDKRMTEQQANDLIARDENEFIGHGQHTRDTFQLADFFVHLDSNSDKTKKSLWRILDLVFGNPFLTPTFDEFAMFMAFASSVRSADLSRQIGAVIAKDEEIIASGVNDCPRFGGGLFDARSHPILHNFSLS